MVADAVAVCCAESERTTTAGRQAVCQSDGRIPFRFFSPFGNAAAAASIVVVSNVKFGLGLGSDGARDAQHTRAQAKRKLLCKSVYLCAEMTVLWGFSLDLILLFRELPDMMSASEGEGAW